MTVEQEIRTCSGISKTTGDPCKARVKEGDTLCWRHNPDYKKKPKKSDVDLTKFKEKVEYIQELFEEYKDDEDTPDSRFLEDMDEELQSLTKMLEKTKV